VRLARADTEKVVGWKSRRGNHVDVEDMRGGWENGEGGKGVY